MRSKLYTLLILRGVWRPFTYPATIVSLSSPLSPFYICFIRACCPTSLFITSPPLLTTGSSRLSSVSIYLLHFHASLSQSVKSFPMHPVYLLSLYMCGLRIEGIRVLPHLNLPPQIKPYQMTQHSTIYLIRPPRAVYRMLDPSDLYIDTKFHSTRDILMDFYIRNNRDLLIQRLRTVSQAPQKQS